jgi:hypothetical protein
MRSTNAVILALVALFAAVQLTACSVPRSTDPHTREQTFLDVASGPLRDHFSDSVLIAEGKKVCQARAQGQNWDQLEQMVAKDLNLDPDSGEASQFMGAVDSGLC